MQTLQKTIERYRAKIALIPKLLPEHTDKGHFYRHVKTDIVFKSVTAKLQILKDQGLRNWYMNRALDYMKSQLEAKERWTPAEIDALIIEAKEAPVIEFRDAGDIGTKIHNMREILFNTFIEEGKWGAGDYVGEGSLDTRLLSGRRAVMNFVKEQGYIPLACELLVFDFGMNVAGTLDDVGLMPNKDGSYDLVIMDLKTSNIGDKDSYYYQVAMYAYMFRKLTGLRAKRTFILHVSKTNGSYKMIPINNVPQLVKEARYILKINDALDRLKQSKARETMKI